MKKTSKKIFGGILVVMLIATIGAVVASAHPFFSDLTDEQRQGMRDLVQDLKEEGATREEIREAMRVQLEEYGYELPTQDEMLDKRIENTEQRLQVLYRIKELRQDPDLTQEQIREIIQEEFDLELPEDGQGMMYRHRGRFGPRGPCGIMTGEETE